MFKRPILIVDDEPDNLALLGQILSQDYELVFARNGTEALAAVAKHNPILILLDIMMPDMDGYSVCRSIKLNPESEAIPVIFVTSKVEVFDEAAGFQAGAVDYLTKPISPLIVKARVRTHLSLVQASLLERHYQEAIFMLGEAAHFKDTDTGVHIWRMAAYTGALAKAAGWREEDCRLIELAAPMHDTGKLGIPDAILAKSEKLNAAEWELIKMHSNVGSKILSRSNAPVFKMAAEIALHHHERWDGSGYPNGLQGEAIPESARIAAIADVFDALSMKRPYKEPWPVDRIMETLHQDRGSHFDPRLIDIFDSILPQILEIKANWDKQEENEKYRIDGLYSRYWQ